MKTSMKACFACCCLSVLNQACFQASKPLDRSSTRDVNQTCLLGKQASKECVQQSPPGLADRHTHDRIASHRNSMLELTRGEHLCVVAMVIVVDTRELFARRAFSDMARATARDRDRRDLGFEIPLGWSTAAHEHCLPRSLAHALSLLYFFVCVCARRVRVVCTNATSLETRAVCRRHTADLPALHERMRV